MMPLNPPFKVAPRWFTTTISNTSDNILYKLTRWQATEKDHAIDKWHYEKMHWHSSLYWKPTCSAQSYSSRWFDLLISSWGKCFWRVSLVLKWDGKFLNEVTEIHCGIPQNLCILESIVNHRVHLPSERLKEPKYEVQDCLYITPSRPAHTLEIMPLRIKVACATWCHCGICQSGERRRSGHLYTVSVQV